MADDPHIVRTAGFDWRQAWRGRHPFNPASEMRMLPLGRANLERKFAERVKLFARALEMKGAAEG